MANNPKQQTQFKNCVTCGKKILAAQPYCGWCNAAQAPAAPAANPPTPPPAPAPTPPPAPTPSANLPTPAAPPDPQDITLSCRHDNNGNFTIFVRVTAAGGVGLAKRVEIFAESRKMSTRTNPEGTSCFCYPRTLNAGEEVEVTATVSGIEGQAHLWLRRPHARRYIPSRWSPSWWLGTNNGRAITFLVVMAVLWSICFYVGFGDQLIPTAPQGQELSSQQKAYNEIAGMVSKGYIIPQAPAITPAGDWQKYFFIFAFLWSIFALIYSPFSLREEVYEGLQNGLNRFLRQTHGRASDPWIEKLMLWCGMRGSVSNPAPRVAAPEGTPTGGVHGNLTFWDLLKSDLISDVTINVIPALLASIFRR